MNRVLKMLIKEVIHNHPLIHSKTTIGDKYSVINKNGYEILTINDSWAINNYSIFVNKRNILSVKWDETNSRPLSNDQKDMLDIINIAKEKIDLQETVQTMTNPELETAHFLQKSLCDIKN